MSIRNEIGEDKKKKQELNKTENHFKKKPKNVLKEKKKKTNFRMKMKTNDGDVAKLIEENRRQGRNCVKTFLKIHVSGL